MVPAITDAEKLKRWEENQTKAAAFGTEVPPVAATLPWTDEQFKEFRTVTFSDETGEHWHEQRTRGRWPTIGLLVRHEAKRLGFSAADEKIANIGGVTRIRNQLTAWPHDLPLDSLRANFYHLAKNVHKSRRIV